MRERRGRVRAITEAGSRAVIVELEAVDPPDLTWRAGQFVSLRVDAAGQRRSFSVVSAPRDSASALELLIGSFGGGATANYIGALTVGDAVDFFGPMGYFTFDDQHRGDVLFGATGIGISAVLPMLAKAATKSQRRVGLHWSVRARADAVLLDRVDAIAGIDLALYVTGAGSGRLTEPLMAAALAATDPLVYLCGNPHMVDDVHSGLAAAGFDVHNRVITEVFYAPSSPLQL